MKSPLTLPSGSPDRPVSRRQFLAGSAAAGVALAGRRGHAQSAGRSPSNTLVVGGWSEPRTLDPAIEVDQWGRSILKNAYDTLVDREGASIDLKPGLARRWTIGNDGRSYTFELRDDVKFVDGTRCDADAVRLGLERVRAINQGFAWMLAGVDKISTVNPTTLRIDLKERYTPFLETLFWFGIPSPAAVQAHDKGDQAREWLRNHTAGSGPYQLDSWEPGQQIVTVRNPGSWKGFASRTPLEAAVGRVINEPSTQRLMLERGDLDVCQITSVDDIPSLQRNADVVVQADPTILRQYYCFLNTKKGPTADKNVRQAIAWAYDYEAHNQLALKGYAKEAVGPFPPEMAGGTIPNIVRYKRDAQKAKEALARSRWPRGGFKLDYYWVTGLAEEKITGELLQSNLRELDIEVSIQAYTFPQIIQFMAKPDTAPHIVPLYTSSTINHPDGFLFFLFYSKGNRNWGFYENPTVDDLIFKARREPDRARATAMYQEISRIITEDAVSLNVNRPVNVDYFRRWVKGYTYNPMYIKMFRLR
ncbi:MAG: ABC transporter substrate-binding protein, partial [Candidatus Rokuibacteriota bacterium]